MVCRQDTTDTTHGSKRAHDFNPRVTTTRRRRELEGHISTTSSQHHLRHLAWLRGGK